MPSTKPSKNGSPANSEQPVCLTYKPSWGAFTAYYNTVRPYRSCDRRTPQHAYHARPPSGSANTPPGIHWRVRADRVDTYGKLTLRHAGRLHHTELPQVLFRSL
jgi:hypothetical protein